MEHPTPEELKPSLALYYHTTYGFTTVGSSGLDRCGPEYTRLTELKTVQFKMLDQTVLQAQRIRVLLKQIDETESSHTIKIDALNEQLSSLRALPSPPISSSAPLALTSATFDIEIPC